ncbi:UNVERIFIED_CONTAM: hypothetical protein Sindi_3059600, partial [Sesamum indicum]
MDSREERSRGGPPPDRPDPTSESKVGSTLDLTRIAPSILLRRGLVSNPGSNRRRSGADEHIELIHVAESPHSPGTTTQLSGARSTTELIAR